MAKKEKLQPYYVINWDFNRDNIEFYDVMPYLKDCWDEEIKREHKLWRMDFEGKNVDGTKMPETFDEFKEFILHNAYYQFWSKCEYEVIVTGWPVQKNEYKLDVFEQIKKNIDVVTKHFMSEIK